jgi:hypothetical protein
VIDTGGFRFGRVLEIHDVNFLPGGAKYFDLPGLLALGAPGDVLLVGEGAEAPELVRTAYRWDQAEARLQTTTGDTAAVRTAAIDWLLRPN